MDQGREMHHILQFTMQLWLPASFFLELNPETENHYFRQRSVEIVQPSLIIASIAIGFLKHIKYIWILYA